MNEFVFDPRVLIRPPYIACPNCHAEEQFGVLMIGWSYTRRCRVCWLPSATTFQRFARRSWGLG